MPNPPAGTDIVLEIDIAGARQVVERFPDALLLFVDTPSIDEQRRRLEARGDPPDDVERRVAHGTTERDAAAELGMRRVVNDDLDRTVEDLLAIIEEARGR